MNNLKLFNNSCKSVGIFCENRVIFQIESPSAWDTVKNVASGVGNLASAGAGLLELGTRVLNDGVNLLEKGFLYAEHGGKLLIDKIKDPGVPVGLAEYNRIATDHPYLKQVFETDTHNQTLNWILKLHVKLAFLNIRSKQLVNFYRPGATELKRVGQKLDEIEQTKSLNHGRKKELEEKIIKIETTLDSGHFLSNDPRKLDLETQLRRYKSELEVLNKSISTEVLWAKPQMIMTEFPVGSGEYIERFVPHPSQRVKVDLKKLYRFLKFYAFKSKPRLEVYHTEMKKLAYHRDVLINEALLYKQNNPFWKGAKSEIKQYIDSVMSSTKFKRKTGSAAVTSPYLASY